MTEIAIDDLTPRNQYTSGGGETSFDYDFPIFDADHLLVQETDPTDLNNPTTLVRGTDYTVTDVGVATGGTIELDSGQYPSGAVEDNIYTITRAVPYERLNDYQFSGDFESSDINSDLDLIIMQIQQLDLRLNATVQLDETDSLTSLPVSIEATADRQNRTLQFNASGTGLEAGPAATEVSNAQTYATNASASATAAASSATAAASSATAAASSEAKAKDWAEEDEDVEVETGQYSAKHWAAKAADFASGTADNISYDNTASGMSAENVQDAIDEISTTVDGISTTVDEIDTALPIGMPFPIWDNITGVTAPDNSGSEKYIKLTAGEDGVGEYNDGLLTNESVSGTAPLVTATADIDLAGSPLNGQTVHLINSEEAFIRARETSGALQHDQFQGHALFYSGQSPGNFQYARTNEFQSGTNRGAINSGGGTAADQEWVEDAAGNGTPREGSETRSKNVSATFYMRIL